MEYDADLIPLGYCIAHGVYLKTLGYTMGVAERRCPHPQCLSIPRFYDPLDYRTHHLRSPRGIGKSAQPNNLIIYPTHSSEKACRSYLKYMEMVTRMERERYNAAHLSTYLLTWPNP